MQVLVVLQDCRIDEWATNQCLDMISVYFFGFLSEIVNY